jgi:hypothetical protein
VALAVATALEKAGARAVLTGGACAAIHTAGAYESEDLDFLLESVPSQARLDEAMSSVGFSRRRDQYFHSGTRFFVEFPPGPLGIGRDLAIRPVRKRIGRRGRGIAILSATDSCRDRLAAFYHWNDRQSLEAAVRIALRNTVDMKKIRTWSKREGASEGLAIFLRELTLAQRRGKSIGSPS